MLSNFLKIAVPKGKGHLKYDRRTFKDHDFALFKNRTFCTKIAFFFV